MAQAKRARKKQAKPRVKLTESDYHARTQVFAKLRDEALFVVEQMLKVSDIRIHSISTRIKTFKSFSDKAARKRLSDPYAEIRDIVGLRIVCLFLSDIERVGTLIEAAFDVQERDNKIEGAEVSSFGYMSFHFIVKMKSTYSGPRYDDIADQLFEIQVRTIAMDAWATTAHYLDYKSEVDVPSDLRRDFFALSGLFYVADRHFEMFFNARRTAISTITSTLEGPSSNWDQELNMDSLRAYLEKSFPDRNQPDSSDISELLNELRTADYTNVKDVKAIVDKNMRWFIEHEKVHPPEEPWEDEPTKGARFAAVGVVRGILNRRQWEEFASKRTEKS